jgi:cell wall-associated NlpC family hydrolase
MMKFKIIILAFGLILSCAASAEVFEPESQIQNEESKDKDTNSIFTVPKQIILNALANVGVQYRWGGESAITGFDCSGFVRSVFLKAVGITLPRTAMEMSRVGTPVQLSDLLPGDLIFFKNARGNFAHVGIYIGMSRFIHAPQTGSAIQIEDLNNQSYFKRFTGGRRVSS